MIRGGYEMILMLVGAVIFAIGAFSGAVLTYYGAIMEEKHGRRP